MPYAILLALLLAAAAAFGAVRNRIKQDSEVIIPGTGIQLSDLGSISWAEVEILLDRLEMKEPPEPVFGAMCYEMVAPPEVAEYVCPVCGEKTLYTDYNTEFIEWELQGCRRLFDEIAASSDMDIQLDETRLCSSCTTADSAETALYLNVILEDGSVVSNRVSEFDLRLLDGFLKGRLFYYTWNDGEEPLKPHIDRIRELLGQPVPAETP
jgi:hypothetical protein